MNFANFTIEKIYTKLLAGAFVAAALLLASTSHAWEVDMSRRRTDFQRIEDQNRLPASETDEVNLLSHVIEFETPAQDVVILNTENGFIPEKVYLNRGQKYNFHVVNVNDKNKNISFMLDAFGENHNTVFGQKKSFEVKARKEGVYTFLCPETTYQGKLIVVDKDRKPASE